MFKFSMFFILVGFVARVEAKPESVLKKDSQPTHIVKNLNLADRFLVESILTDIFGPETKNISRKLIFNRPFVFGGPCDLYEQIRLLPRDDVALDPETLCPGGRESFSAPIKMSSNILRSAHVEKVCRTLTSKKETLDFALSKIFPKGSVVSPNQESIKKAYSLFYPEAAPTEELIAVLNGLGKKSVKDKHKRWGLIFFTLCIDPTWQLI